MNTFDEPASADASTARRHVPRIRETCFEDYPQIAAVQARNGLPARPRHDWVQLWKGNPAYDGEFPLGWVLETESGEIVGTIGNVPFSYFLRGRPLRAAAATDWAVNPPYRAHSLGLLDRLSKQPGIDFAICTTVSESSHPAYPAMRWSKAPAGTWDRADLWITGYRGFLASALRRRGTTFASALAYPAAIALACRDRLRTGARRFNFSEHEIAIQAEFGPRFQAFWEELKREKQGVLLGLRTPEALAWHLRNSLAGNRVWIAAASKDSRMVAYAIAERHDNARYGLKRVRLVDAQALGGSEGVLDSLLRRLLEKCRNEGIHALECTGCWLGPHMAAPHQRALPVWAYYYKAVNRELSTALADPAVWAPTALDGDQAL